MCKRDIFAVIIYQGYARVQYIHENEGGATDIQTVNTVLIVFGNSGIMTYNSNIEVHN